MKHGNGHNPQILQGYGNKTWQSPKPMGTWQTIFYFFIYIIIIVKYKISTNKILPQDFCL